MPHGFDEKPFASETKVYMMSEAISLPKHHAFALDGIIC